MKLGKNICGEKKTTLAFLSDIFVLQNTKFLTKSLRFPQDNDCYSKEDIKSIICPLKQLTMVVHLDRQLAWKGLILWD